MCCTAGQREGPGVFEVWNMPGAVHAASVSLMPTQLLSQVLQKVRSPRQDVLPDMSGQAPQGFAAEPESEHHAHFKAQASACAPPSGNAF